MLVTKHLRCLWITILILHANTENSNYSSFDTILRIHLMFCFYWNFNLPLGNQLRYCDASTNIKDFNRRECKWQTLVATYFQKKCSVDSNFFRLHTLHISTLLDNTLDDNADFMMNHLWWRNIFKILLASSSSPSNINRRIDSVWKIG